MQNFEALFNKGSPKDYEFEKHIGMKIATDNEGKIGIVVEKETGRWMVAKTIQVHNQVDTNDAKREASIVMSVKHPNIMDIENIFL